MTQPDIPPHPLGKWGTPIELEVRRRIQVSVAAYAYEIANAPVMSDAAFDWLAERVSKHMGTYHPLLDEFFITQFSPMTGMWIHNHPELEGIARIYARRASDMREYFSRKDQIRSRCVP